MGRYKPRALACSDCGAVVVKVPRWDRPIYCLECATTRMSTAAIEMADKRGPAWEAWCASNATGARTGATDTGE